MSQNGFIDDFVKPGIPVWFYADQEGEIKLYGDDGSMTYQGYQVIGTVTFLIFDHTTGAGKKAKMNSLSINAFDVKRMGRIGDPFAE